MKYPGISQALLIVSVACFPLTLASIKEKFSGQRLIFLTIGSIAASLVVKNSENIQSSWERKAARQLIEIQRSRQQLREGENAIALQRQAMETDRIALKNKAQELERSLSAEFKTREEAISLQVREMNLTLEHRKQQLLTDTRNQIEQISKSLREAAERDIERIQNQLEKAQQDAQLWQRRYEALQRPKFPQSTAGTHNYLAEKFILMCWKREQAIKIDCGDRQPLDDGKAYIFWVQLRDNSQFSDLKKLETEFALNEGLQLVKIERVEGERSVRVECPNPKYFIPTKQDLKTGIEQSLLKVEDLGAKRSFLVTGHPGAGKTSTMIYIGQTFGEDAQKLALNPHDDEKSSYGKYGFFEINNVQDIIQQIYLLKDELLLRGSDNSRRFKLVVCIDELGRILDSAGSSKDAKELMGILKQISVEGRKLGLVVILGNHSQTTSAVLMDGEFRNSFYQLFLVGAARYLISQPGKNCNLSDIQEKWVQNAGYPAISLINGQYKLCQHPTHHEYETYKDDGNIPKNLKEQKPVKLTISLPESYQAYQNINSVQLSSIGFAKHPPNTPSTQTQPEPNSTKIEPVANLQASNGNGYAVTLVEPEIIPNPKTPISGNPTQPESTLGDKVAKLLADGVVSPAKIVEAIWGLKPSKSQKYKARVGEVLKALKQLGLSGT